MFFWKSPQTPLFQRGEFLPLVKGGKEGFDPWCIYNYGLINIRSQNTGTFWRILDYGTRFVDHRFRLCQTYCTVSEKTLHRTSFRTLSKYARIPPSSAGGMNGLPSPLGPACAKPLRRRQGRGLGWGGNDLIITPTLILPHPRHNSAGSSTRGREVF